MANTYPKQYILHRIGARKVSLEAAQREAEGEAIEVAELINDQLDNWMDTVNDLLYQARSVRVLNVEDARRKVALAKQAIETRIPGEGSVGFYPENDTPEGALTRRARAVHLAEAGVQRRAAELDAIEHVTAYLQGTPVEEFTLSQLRTLGLLDFVKFNLARAKGEN